MGWEEYETWVSKQETDAKFWLETSRNGPSARLGHVCWGYIN